MEAIKSLAWRMMYAGRLMEITRCRFSYAWKQARIAQECYSDWKDHYPKDLADHRARLFHNVKN